MNVLFLTIGNRIREISTRGVYKDLMRKFRDEGHTVFIVNPSQRRNREKTGMIRIDGVSILVIKTLNITKTNLLEKGIATLIIQKQFMRVMKKYFSDVHFELIIYSTPPVTFAKVIQYFRLRDKALSYLLLKDIFPQNAVDLGMIKQNGFLHGYFRKEEKKLYSVSDFIGCMSPANVDYIRKNNPEINPGIIEVNPNSIEPIEQSFDEDQKAIVRLKYNIPLDKPVLIYGGSIGKPQGIDFVIDILNSRINDTSVFFVFVGSGVEFPRLKAWFDLNNPGNAVLIEELPKSEFDVLTKSCDTGLIFLDKRFTIPNFPSRLLSYLEFKLPVIAATDKNTDLGKIMLENNFGFWSETGDLKNFSINISKLSNNDVLRREMGQNGYDFMLKNYTVSNSYSIIYRHLQNL